MIKTRNFAMLSGKFAEYSNSKFAVVPVPYEQTTSYCRGTKNGPDAIIKASSEIELFDYETKTFSEDARAAYVDYMRAHPDTALTEVLKEYFSYLASINFILDYNDKTMSKVFFDTCDYLVSIAEKKVSK